MTIMEQIDEESFVRPSIEYLILAGIFDNDDNGAD